MHAPRARVDPGTPELPIFKENPAPQSTDQRTLSHALRASAVADKAYQNYRNLAQDDKVLDPFSGLEAIGAF